jgi:SAM-dependent methyltransferase
MANVLYSAALEWDQGIEPDWSALQAVARSLDGPSWLQRFFSVFCSAHYGDSAGNAYHKDAMLSAFNTFYHNAPFVKFGHDMALKSIERRTLGVHAFTLIDIGFGSGLQWRNLVERANRPIHIVGIDLPTPNNKVWFEQFAKMCAGTPAKFTGVLSAIEYLDLAQLQALSLEHEFTIVNASLTLHHVLPDSISKGNGRQKLLSMIRQLEPECLITIEPDSDHSNLSRGATMIEAMAHYMCVFEALDFHLAGHPDLYIIENAFFGQEMRNILRNDGAARFERHERHETWVERMSAAGFSEACHFTQTWKRKPLLVVAEWEPRPALACSRDRELVLAA